VNLVFVCKEKRNTIKMVFVFVWDEQMRMKRMKRR